LLPRLAVGGVVFAPVEVRAGVCERDVRWCELPDELDVAEEFFELWVA
jgi:hypothetical protein